MPVLVATKREQFRDGQICAQLTARVVHSKRRQTVRLQLAIATSSFPYLITLQKLNVQVKALVKLLNEAKSEQ